MTDPISTLAGQTILQEPLTDIHIGAHTYDIPSPSIATLIRVSELLAQTPLIPTEDLKASDIIYTSLHYAKDYRIIGLVVAVLVLGAKTCDEPVTHRHGFLGLRRETHKRCEWLAIDVLETMTPTEVLQLLVQLIKTLDIAPFFAITTSLNAINLLRPTKHVRTAEVDEEVV